MTTRIAICLTKMLKICSTRLHEPYVKQILLAGVRKKSEIPLTFSENDLSIKGYSIDKEANVEKEEFALTSNTEYHIKEYGTQKTIIYLLVVIYKEAKLKNRRVNMCRVFNTNEKFQKQLTCITIFVLIYLER